MTIGTTIPSRLDASSDRASNFPASFVGVWENCIDAGGLATADNASITNVTTQIVVSTTHIFQKPEFGGTLIRARVGYDPTLTGTTGPTVVLFGRTRYGGTRTGGMMTGGTVTQWERLYNQDDTPTTAVLMTMAPTTDLIGSDGLAYTEVDPKVHTWDCNGCNEFVFGIQIALVGSTGTKTTSIFQRKWL